jgi:hypothetical protein
MAGAYVIAQDWTAPAALARVSTACFPRDRGRVGRLTDLHNLAEEVCCVCPSPPSVRLPVSLGRGSCLRWAQVTVVTCLPLQHAAAAAVLDACQRLPIARRLALHPRDLFHPDLQAELSHGSKAGAIPPPPSRTVLPSPSRWWEGGVRMMRWQRTGSTGRDASLQ